MTLISNSYRTSSLSIPSVQRELNETKGYDLDPLELLIGLEERAHVLWSARHSTEPRAVFVDQYVADAIARL
jgi:hypothetical protein